MTTIFINITIIFALIVLAYISFQVGIIKTVFAVCAGAVAIVLAENYPYQYGINYYLIFVVSAFAIFLIGLFIARVLKFFCLSIFDKIAGGLFGLCLGIIVCANCVVPSLTQEINVVESKLANTVLNISQKSLPMFDKYIPDFVISQKVKDSKKYVLFQK